VWLVIIGALAVGYVMRAQDAQKAAPEAKPKPPQTVAVVEVPQGIVREAVGGHGTVRAVKHELMTFEQNGRVVFIGTDADGKPLRAGSRVVGPKVGDDKKVTLGQLLARIDSRDEANNLVVSKVGVSQSKLDVRQARAALKQAKSDRSLAKAELRRTEELFKTGEASAAQLESARAKVKSADANVSSRSAALAATKGGVTSAKAKLGQAERSQERTEIRAPFDGVLAAVNLRIGDTSGPNSVDNSSQDRQLATAPFVVIDPTSFEASIDLPAFVAKRVKPGQPALLLGAEASLEDLRKYKDPRDLPASLGYVFAIDAAISPGSRSVRVTIRTTHNTHLLKDGQFVQARIVTATAEDVVVAPLEGVVFRDNQAYGFVVDPTTSKVQRRKLDVGVRSLRTFEVTKGLTKGELLVTDGRHRLSPGAPTEIVKRTAADIGWQGKIPKPGERLPAQEPPR